jgi:hypothetical protein
MFVVVVIGCVAPLGAIWLVWTVLHPPALVLLLGWGVAMVAVIPAMRAMAKRVHGRSQTATR